jgi:hypothetical protein
MRNVFLCTAAVAAMAWSAQALAQAPQSGAVNPPKASTGSAANTTAMASALTVGLTVKDSTGATVGKLIALKTDASGKEMATIHMGTHDVSIGADRLKVKDGAAVADATKTELQTMAKKPKS